MLREKQWGHSVRNIPTVDLTNDYLKQMFELEQDMWARWLWEYLICNDCKKVFSKSDIYDWPLWSKQVENFRLETVSEIERNIWTIPECPCCNGITKHICGEEHLNKIIGRHWLDESFLTLAFNTQGKIIWLMDWFSASFEEIYRREFYAHFHEELFDIIEDLFWISHDTKVLTVSSLWMDDKHKNLWTTRKIVEDVTWSFPSKYDDIPVIVEAIVGSVTYTLFKIMWAELWNISRDFPDVLCDDIKHGNFKLDILYQANWIGDYKKRPIVSLRELILQHKK
jgi:hypothetical protein